MGHFEESLATVGMRTHTMTTVWLQCNVMPIVEQIRSSSNFVPQSCRNLVRVSAQVEPQEIMNLQRSTS